MAIREFWIWKSSAATFAYEKIKADNHPSKDELIHVIDATGMPSKEEICSALLFFNYPKTQKHLLEPARRVYAWLETLVAE